MFYLLFYWLLPSAKKKAEEDAARLRLQQRAWASYEERIVDEHERTD
jgi:cbb3-type cytochrome oxidase subunit 3